MESVVYDGPQPSRTLELGPGKIITVTKGEPFEVPADVAEQLLEQRHFSSTKKPSKLTQLQAQAAELGIEGAEDLKTIKAAESAIATAVAEAQKQADNTAAGDGAQKEGE